MQTVVHPGPESKRPSTAYLLDWAVRMAGGVFCPLCSRELRATDAIVERERVLVRCNECHRDLMTIEQRD
jgi:hypothetical protein